MTTRAFFIEKVYGTKVMRIFCAEFPPGPDGSTCTSKSLAPGVQVGFGFFVLSV